MISAEMDEFEKDPWNATVIVGLRVYHKSSDEEDCKNEVNLKVVRPPVLGGRFPVEGDCYKILTLQRKATGLDVDDSAKDATLEGGVKERKMSILGDALRTAE